MRANQTFTESEAEKTVLTFLYAVICTIKNVNRFALRRIVLYDNGSDILLYSAISFSARSLLNSVDSHHSHFAFRIHIHLLSLCRCRCHRHRFCSTQRRSIEQCATEMGFNRKSRNIKGILRSLFVLTLPVGKLLIFICITINFT